MDSTNLSMLERLRRPGEQEAWRQFVVLYTPLLWHWARRLGLPDQEIPDFLQEVLLLLVRKMPEFVYAPGGRFRGWLWTVLVNKYRERRRKAPAPRQAESGLLDGVAEPDPIPAFDEAEYRQHIARRALELMRAEFQPTTWQACWESVVGGKSSDVVARELGLSPGAVRVAKFRVLTRLRTALDGLLD